MMGYEQSYLSALEVGSKGPPTAEFVERLASVLSLNTEQIQALDLAVEMSQRKLTIPCDAPEDVYLLLHALSQSLPTLHPAHINLLRQVLDLPFALKQQPQFLSQRLARRSKLRD